MLDAFKSFAGGRGKDVQKQTDELQLLIATAREERGAISAMLNALSTRSAKLAPLGKQLEQVTEKATAVTDKLDDIAKRLTSLDGRAGELEEIDRRIESLKEAARQAELTTQQAIGPDGELHRHREAVQHLSSQALETQAVFDTLSRDRAGLDELSSQLRVAENDVKSALGHAGALKGELDQVRSTAASLQLDYSSIREASREAREDTKAALATVLEVEQKLGPLAQLQELSQSTDERLTALNALSEHVSRKAKALESQQQVVEHAVVQANRLNEMVWSMDEQIGKLSDGMKQAATAEESIGRIERLTLEVAAQLDAAERTRQDAGRETVRLTKSTASLVEAGRGHVDALAVKTKEFEAFDERVAALQSSVGDAESRMTALAAKDRTLVELGQKIDGFSRKFETLSAQSDDLAANQRLLETLHEQIGIVDEAAKQATSQMDALRHSRDDLDGRRKEIENFYESHSEVFRLRDKLDADRQALEGFGDRINSLSARAPELEVKMEAILGQMKVVEEGTQKATRLNQLVADLDAQISRVTARLPFVETLETRLDGLSGLSAQVDHTLTEQLARRTELETLKTICDGMGEQLIDTQHKLESVRQLQARLLPLVGEFHELESEIVMAHERLGSVMFDEGTLAEQEQRIAALVEEGRGVAIDVAERTREMRVMSEAFGRTTGIKDELLAELDRVQRRQRDAAGQIQASEDQLARAEKILNILEQRRAQVAFGEKKLTEVESRLSDMRLIADELDKNSVSIVSRDQMIKAVKAEVDAIHEISTRTRADLSFVTRHQPDVATLKAQVDVLLSLIAETDAHIAAIDERRKQVDEVHAKANATVHLLDDVRINLEMLGEQKAVVDHVSEKAAQLEFMVQEARNTTRTLQHERELAERIEQSIKQLRAAKTPANAEEKLRSA